MTDITDLDVYKNWVELAANVAKARGLVLTLLAHPDVTDAQILEAARSYKRTMSGMRETQKSVVQALEKLAGKNPSTSRMRAQMRIDAVKGWS